MLILFYILLVIPSYYIVKWVTINAFVNNYKNGKWDWGNVYNSFIIALF